MIQPSGGLTPDQIEEMLRQAEAGKEAQEAELAVMRLKNDADRLVYDCESQMREHSDKVAEDVKARVNADISTLNEAIVSDDTKRI
jgi:molecular chaperone DnaK